MSRGKAPVRVPGDKVPQKMKHIYHFPRKIGPQWLLIAFRHDTTSVGREGTHYTKKFSSVL